MEMQEPENFCGMARKFNEALEPLIEIYDKLDQLVNANENVDAMNKTATTLLQELDKVFLDCALEFLEEDDMKEACEEWRTLDPNFKLELVRSIWC